jgi:O-antigen ligase
MSPSVALTLWLILLVGLLIFDPAKEPRTSLALWAPVIWMFIVASRLPSQWMGNPNTTSSEAMAEGNPIDRAVFLFIIAVSIGILISRSFKWGSFFTRNLALMSFISFGLLSVLWSDFPFIAFKRWFRDLGSYLVVLVVLSDPRPLEAVRTLLRRLCYLLIPLSVVLVKYYPEMGRQYDKWIGTAYYSGVTTSKNMLGVLCLVSGIFFFWDTLTRWSDREEKHLKGILAVNFAFIAMTLWLLYLSDSATSRVCLLIGCLVIAAAHSRAFQRHPGFLVGLIPACVLLYPILAVGLGMNGELAAAVGRDSSLTTRTEIWKILLGVHANPLVGTGYESFWLGSRLQSIWMSDIGTVTEAHNGYLEIYLNLGLAGLLLLFGFLMASYRTICRRLRPFSPFASLTLALWTVLLFYNVTEAAFKIHFMWVTFLVGALVVPVGVSEPPAQLAESIHADAAEPDVADVWK